MTYCSSESSRVSGQLHIGKGQLDLMQKQGGVEINVSMILSQSASGLNSYKSLIWGSNELCRDVLYVTISRYIHGENIFFENDRHTTCLEISGLMQLKLRRSTSRMNFYGLPIQAGYVMGLTK